MFRPLPIITLLFFISGASGQPVQVWLDTVSGCSGDTIEIELKTDEFFQVGSLTLYVNYDTNALDYDTTTYLNPQLPGLLAHTAFTGQHCIAFAWFSSTMTPVSIGTGTLAVMRFILLDENTSLSFNPQCEVTNITGQLLPAQYTGSPVVKKVIPVTQQPQDYYSVPGGTADFSIQTGAPGILFKWQSSSDMSLWNDITDDQHYYGSSTNYLTVTNVDTTFNGIWFRCRLTMGNCTGFSDAALLKVDSAQAVDNIVKGTTPTCPYPNPFSDYIVVPLEGLNSQTCIFRIIDLSGRLLFERHFTDSRAPLSDIVINDLSIPPGFYFSTIAINDKNNKYINLKYRIISK